MRHHRRVPADARPRNWAGNVVFGVDRVHAPASVEELQALVSGARRVRALGTGHSFNDVADTAGVLVSVARLPGGVVVDRERMTASVPGGATYGAVARELHAAGVALPSLGSLPHISVAGACATGTHGGGDRNPCLAAQVSGVELVGPDGALVRADRALDPSWFGAAVLSLGCLGVVTRVELDVVPAFDVRQDVYEGMPLAVLTGRFDEVTGQGWSVSAFTTWRDPDRVDQVWVKRRLVDGPDEEPDPPASWLGGLLADGPRHPIPALDPRHCSEQGVRGPWHERLPHFRAGWTPSSGRELQSEWLLPRSLAGEALVRVAALRDRLAPVLQVCEVRTVAADDLWLSPASGHDSVGVHMTWTDDAVAVRPVVAALEQALLPLGARPHWGKVFAVGRDVLRERYPRWDDVQRLVDARDPDGVFRNTFSRRLFPLGG